MVQFECHRVIHQSFLSNSASSEVPRFLALYAVTGVITLAAKRRDESDTRRSAIRKLGAARAWAKLASELLSIPFPSPPPTVIKGNKISPLFTTIQYAAETVFGE